MNWFLASLVTIILVVVLLAVFSCVLQRADRNPDLALRPVPLRRTPEERAAQAAETLRRQDAGLPLERYQGVEGYSPENYGHYVGNQRRGHKTSRDQPGISHSI